MLQKLRSRHPIDLPAEGFGHKKAILAVLGGIAVLFILVPFLLSPLAALYRGLQDGQALPRALLAIAAGVGTLVLVILLGAARGKSGWRR